MNTISFYTLGNHKKPNTYNDTLSLWESNPAAFTHLRDENFRDYNMRDGRQKQNIDRRVDLMICHGIAYWVESIFITPLFQPKMLIEYRGNLGLIVKADYAECSISNLDGITRILYDDHSIGDFKKVQIDDLTDHQRDYFVMEMLR